MLRKSQAFASGLIALFVVSRLSAASFTYTTFTVPNSENLTTFPSGIDSSGEVGGSFQNLNGVLQAFVRGTDGRSYTDFSVPGSTFTTALGMNGDGDVIGLFALPLGQTSVYIRASNGTFTMPTLFNGPANIVDLGLNNRGQIAGALQNAGQFQSFFCVGTGGGPCEQIAVAGATATVVKGINNLGQLVGYVNVGAQVHGFVLNPDGSQVIFDEPDATGGTQATGINDLGQIVGFYASSTGVHDFLRNPDGSFVSIVPDPSNDGFAGAINNSGQITGYITPGFNEYQGFIATPIPEPNSAGLLMVIGLAALFRRKRESMRDGMSRVSHNVSDRKPKIRL